MRKSSALPEKKQGNWFKGLGMDMRKNYDLYWMAIPGVLFYLLFNSRTVIARIENVWYHTGVLAVSAAVLLITMWQTVIVPCCL